MDISVVCAPPNGQNPGMASVDLAFGQIAALAGADEVTYWRLWDHSETLEPHSAARAASTDPFFDPDTGLTYHNLRGNLEQALSARCVVYWGDFLHLASYQRIAADVLANYLGLFPDAATAADYASNHLLLSHQAPTVLSKVMSYGTTLSLNSAADYAGDYGPMLRRFLTGVNRIWVRDPYSAVVAREARGNPDESCYGVDAAFLLDVEPNVHRGESLGVYFGRSTFRPESVALFSRAIAKRLDLRGRWIQWGDEPAFWPMDHRRRFRLAWPGLDDEDAASSWRRTFSSYHSILRGREPRQRPTTSAPVLLRQLAQHAVIITDTYHLAVNAWRVGTPAVCIIDRPSATWNVNSGVPSSARDKRWDLYSTIDALGLIVPESDLRLCYAKTADRVAEYLAATSLLTASFRRIESLARQSRECVAGTIESLLRRR
jgi:hypothetical protein